jgi:hypothetical protein
MPARLYASISTRIHATHTSIPLPLLAPGLLPLSIFYSALYSCLLLTVAVWLRVTCMDPNRQHLKHLRRTSATASTLSSISSEPSDLCYVDAPLTCFKSPHPPRRHDPESASHTAAFHCLQSLLTPHLESSIVSRICRRLQSLPLPLEPATTSGPCCRLQTLPHTLTAPTLTAPALTAPALTAPILTVDTIMVDGLMAHGFDGARL